LFHISVWGSLDFCLGAKPIKVTRGHGTVLVAAD